MRFSEKLSAHLTPEWRQQYVAYENLKAVLLDAVENAPQPVSGQPDELTRSMERYMEQFFQQCDMELRKVNNFYAEKLAEAARKHEELMERLHTCLKVASERQRASRRSNINLGMVLTKRKTETLRSAFSEYYLSLVMLQNYQTLNHTAFRKILKKHDKLMNTNKGLKWFERNVDKSPFVTNGDIMNLIREIENTFTKNLEGGDRARAMKRLRVPPIAEVQHPWTTFRVGLFMGAFLVISVAAFLKFSHEHYTTANYVMLLHLFRGPLLLIVFLFLLSINVYGWRKAGVNHILIFEIDPRDHLTASHIMNVAMIFAFVWSLCLLGFAYSRDYGLPPYSLPFTFALIVAAYALNPIHIFQYSSRVWSLKLIGRVIAAPFFHVGFRDFWLGDQLNSLSCALLDLKYFIFFYASNWNWYDTTSKTQYGDHVFNPIIVCLPCWFRFLQCLRRFFDSSKSFSVLINAAKYASYFVVIFFSTMRRVYKDDYQNTFDNPYVWCYLITGVINSILCYVWDVIKDFGIFTKFKGDNIFIRDQIVYPASFYYFAIIANFTLRFFWLYAFYLEEHNLMLAIHIQTMQAFLELFRRHIWNYLRLENEHLFNAGKFRAVRDIALTPLDPLDQLTLQRMMDDPDGVSNRRSTAAGNKKKRV